MAKSLLTQDPDATPVQQFDLVTTLKDFYAQDADPGAVGTGSVWKDTSTVPAYQWWERNAANDGWDATVSLYVVATDGNNATAIANAVAVDGLADASSFADALGGSGEAVASLDARADSGNATAKAVADTAGGAADASSVALSATGAADAHSAATSAGAGAADATATATSATGNATSGIKAVRGAVEASVLVDSTNTNARVRAVASDISLTATDALVLTGTTSLTISCDGDIEMTPLGNVNINSNPIFVQTSVPVLPAIPTEQDIADALVALGLVTQTP